MASGRNPFTPSFGVSPPVLSGRDEILSDFEAALEEGVGSPGRASMFTGLRGSGKTVLLNALEDRAHDRGWAIVSVTTRPGIADEVSQTHLPTLLAQHHPGGSTESVITGGSASVAGFGGGVTREQRDRFPVEASLRSGLTELADVMAQRDAGVLITVDEVGLDGLRDLQELTQVVQHCFREGREVAFVAAGLPSQVSPLLSAPGTTFLRRAEQTHLGQVSADDVAAALRSPIMHGEKTIPDDALRAAAHATQGYPFMVQLVGYHSWRAAKSADTISPEHVAEGVQAASRRVGKLVHEPALSELSGIDRSFLAAMARDDGPSRVRDVAERLGVDGNYVNVYRARLINAEIIHAPGWGVVDFTLPSMREYLREHAVTDLAMDPPRDRLTASQEAQRRHDWPGRTPGQPPPGLGPSR